MSYSKPPILNEGTMTPVEIGGTAVMVSFHFYYGENLSIYKGFPMGKLDLSVS